MSGESPVARPRLVIGVLASCGTVVSLMNTLVVPLLPRFPDLLGVSHADASWLITITLLTGAVLAPVLGRLGDMYGKRRMLLVALAVMSAGSVLGALGDGYVAVLLARALQGTALGVIALGISIMRDLLPPDRVGAGTALMSSTLGIGGAVGLPLCAFVAQTASYQWVFAGSAVLGFGVLALVRVIVPESVERTGGRFDTVGAVGLSIGLVGLLLAVSKGNTWGWSSPLTLTAIAAAVLVLPLWGYHQLRSRSPLVDLRISARRPVLLTNIASVATGFAMFASFVASAPMLQAPVATGYGFGVSLVVSGLLLLPVGIAMTVVSPLSARMSSRYGARTTLVVGASVLVVGNLMRAFLHNGLAVVMIGVTVIGIGAALAFSALPTLIMQAVPTTETGAANSLNTLARTIGTSACSAVLAALTSAFTVGIGGVTIPAELGYTVLFAVAAGAALLAMGLAIGLPRRSPIAIPVAPMVIPTPAGARRAPIGLAAR